MGTYKRFCKYGHDTSICGRNAKNWCILCAKKYLAEYTKTDKYKALKKEYAKEYNQLPEVIKYNLEYAKEYRQSEHGKETRNAQRRTRRARLVNACDGETKGVTREQWSEIVEQHDGICFYCDKLGTTMDHIMPLAKGGKHSPENVVPCCRPCNTKKNAKHPIEWLLIVLSEII